MDERSFIHLHPSSERNVLIHLKMDELRWHLKMDELRWQDVLIHLKMDELAQTDAHSSTFIHLRRAADPGCTDAG
jgi:hypothetical protein